MIEIILSKEAKNRVVKTNQWLLSESNPGLSPSCPAYEPCDLLSVPSLTRNKTRTHLTHLL